MAGGAKCHIVRLILHQQVGLGRRMRLVAGQAVDLLINLAGVGRVHHVADGMPHNRVAASILQRQHDDFVLDEVVIRQLHRAVEDGHHVLGLELLRL